MSHDSDPNASKTDWRNGPAHIVLLKSGAIIVAFGALAYIVGAFVVAPYLAQL